MFCINMNREYGETDPIIEKSQFLQSLCEQIIAGHKFAKGQQSKMKRLIGDERQKYALTAELKRIMISS